MGDFSGIYHDLRRVVLAGALGLAVYFALIVLTS